MDPEMYYKVCKFHENFQLWGSYTLIIAPMEVKFGTDGGEIWRAISHPIGAMVQNTSKSPSE